MATAAQWLGWLILLSPLVLRAEQPWDRFPPAQDLLQGETASIHTLVLEVPMVTQNGASVPLTVSLRQPLPDGEYIEQLHVLGTGNPSPEIVEFSFSSLADLSEITTRVRLNQSQTVIALGRTNTGRWLAHARTVRVTVSGCIQENHTADRLNMMEARVRTPRTLRPGQPAEIRTMIRHPMETGLRKDADGGVVPQNIIHRFEAALADKKILTARFHRAMAANPYVLFRVAPGQAGLLRLTWEDDTGRTTTADEGIPAS